MKTELERLQGSIARTALVVSAYASCASLPRGLSGEALRRADAQKAREALAKLEALLEEEKKIVNG
jgi:hypothetical protein